MLNLLQVLSVNFLCGADFLFSHPSGFRWAAIVEYHPFAKWVCTPHPLTPRLGQQGRYQWSASRLHLSFLQSPGQLSAHILPLSHPPLGETFCTATQCLLSCMSLVSDREQMFGSLCVSGQSEETQCEGQTQVRLGVKNCSHMMHPDQVFRTLWATSGYLRQQGTDLQGSGCGSAVTWYLVLFTWAVSFCAKWLQALGLIWRHTFCLCLLLFLLSFFLHGFACWPVGPIRALLLLGSLRNQQTRGLKPGSAATWSYKHQRAFWNCCVFSLRAIREKSKPPGDIQSKIAVIAAGGTRLGLGQHLSDQACRRHWRRQGLFIHLHLIEAAEEQSRHILLSVYGAR